LKSKLKIQNPYTKNPYTQTLTRSSISYTLNIDRTIDRFEGLENGEGDRGYKPYTLHLKPYAPTPKPHTLNATRYSYTLHSTPYTLYPTPYTLHPTPYTIHPGPEPKSVDPKPYTLRQNHGSFALDSLECPRVRPMDSSSSIHATDLDNSNTGQ